MIYVAKGITTPTMKRIKGTGSPGEDFEYIRDYKPEDIPSEWQKLIIEHNGQPFTKAKLVGKYFIAGKMREENGLYKRKSDSITNRTLIILDLDETQLSFPQVIERLKETIGNYHWLIYPTASHSSEKTKARIVIEPNRQMIKNEYIKTTEYMKDITGLEFDKASTVWAQHMGLPINYTDHYHSELIYCNTGIPFPVQEVTTDNIPEYQTKGTIIHEGGRNDSLFKIGASMQAIGLSDDHILEELLNMNSNKNHPPLQASEVMKIYDSITKRYPKGNSYQVTPETKTPRYQEAQSFLELKNQNNPSKGYKVNVSLLAMHIYTKYDLKIYKSQFRIKDNNYYARVENIRGLINSEIPHENRVPKDIEDCEKLLAYNSELELTDAMLAEENFISFTNGVLDIKTMIFMSHDDQKIENKNFINQIGIDYNPKVNEDKITDDFFNSITNNNETDKRYLYQILGVMISGYRSFKNIFYFTGDKDTGKSRFLKLAELLLTNPDGTKDYSNIGLKVLTDETSKEFSGIIGKRANISAETPDLRINNDTLLKSLSGGDTINAHIKYSKPIEFVNKAMLLFAGNTVPSFFISDRSSLAERLLIFKFKNKIPKASQIKEIEKKMNLEYVIQLAIRGLNDFINNNQEFLLPNEIIVNREEVLSDSDPLYKFYKDCYVSTVDDGDRISRDEIFGRYLLYLENEGFVKDRHDLSEMENKENITTKNMFTKKFSSIHGKQNYKRSISYNGVKADCFIGIKLKKPQNELTERVS